MAKRKNSKKEDIKQEVIEFVNNEELVNEDKFNEEIVKDIEPIDMTEEIKEIEKEIFEEPKKEETKIEEKPKNNISKRFNQMIGYIWNGVEYDF